MVHLREVVVPGCDLAIATGQQTSIDQPHATSLLATMEVMGGMDSFRLPGIFGAALPIDADAAPRQRLLSYLGRNPTLAQIPTPGSPAESSEAGP